MSLEVLSAHLRLPEFRVEDVNIRHAADSLSRIYRYAGNSRYSVGQHSLIVVQLVRFMGCTKEEEQWGLVHDLGEYLYGDILYWLKVALGDQLKTVTDPLDAVVNEAVGMQNVSEETKRRVKIADNAAAHLEALHEFETYSSGEVGLELVDRFREVNRIDCPMSSKNAASLFRLEFRRLFGEDLFRKLGG